MSFFSGCARVLLIVFNLIFWLSGAAILGVGIWILVDPDLQDYQDIIKDATDDEEFLKIAAYILIGFGSFVFLVGFCGCCGAIRSNKCLLGFYILFLVLIFAGELAAGIYVAVYKGDVEDKMQTGLTRSIQKNYKDTLSNAWDFVQNELDCCGGVSSADYDNSTWQNAEPASIKIPKSCCVRNANGQITNVAGCQEKLNTDYYHSKGCKDALIDWVDDHSVILIGVACGVAALQIIGLVCAICFCRHMDRDKYNSS